MISYLEKEAKRDEWVATWQFLQRSWQELPENSDEESYMRPNCLVSGPNIISCFANIAFLLSEQILQKDNLSQPKSIAGEQLTTPKNDNYMRLALYVRISRKHSTLF